MTAVGSSGDFPLTVGSGRPSPDRVNVVAVDHNTTKEFAYLAGWYRGQGVPGVYVARKYGEQRRGVGETLAGYGWKVVPINELAGWLATTKFLDGKPDGDAPTDDLDVEGFRRERCPVCGGMAFLPTRREVGGWRCAACAGLAVCGTCKANPAGVVRTRTVNGVRVTDMLCHECDERIA